MKFGDLVSVAHNLATSVSDGDSFLFGTHYLDIHGAALASPDGRIVIDFLAGAVVEGNASNYVRATLAKSPHVLAQLALQHGAIVSDYRVLTARYGTDRVHGPHFTVIVEDDQGRRSEEKYQGYTGRRLRRGHKSSATA